MCNFGHIHCHSEYSTLDGMGKVRELITTAKSLGQDFIAITDHGTMSGIYEAQQIGDELGVKVILGCEFYYERENDGKNGHLLVLAKNATGLTNMFKMSEWASKYNFHRKPRINWETLKEHAEGLIVTSACLGSTFNQYIMAGQVADATAWARKFKDVFGDDFYIEIQPNQIPEQFLCNKTGVSIARQLGIKIVATNDVHYTLESDCFPHEVLLAMQMKKKMSDEKRFKFSTDDFWLKSEEEMYETFTTLDKEVVQEAINSTREIADKCDARIEKGHYLPHYHTIPEGESERSLLASRIKEGITKRGGIVKSKDYIKEVQHELDVIDRNGYSGYFLIVQDYVTSAKQRGDIVGDGRGSGAGSKVAYVTGITEIPPHEFDLLFERFMADGRSPDFDVDFSDQSAVFRDLQRKYGDNAVARIIAFGRMTPRAVIRKVFNTFEHPMHLQSEITKYVPDLCKSLSDAYQTSPELLEYKKKYPVEWEVIERLENVISHESQHAGGVLIYPELGQIVPVKYDRNEEILVAAWDKYMLEDLGHFKFDVLGLETLPVIRNTIDSIERVTGKRVDLYSINYDDPNVYDMLCKGDVSGVFQIAAQSGKVMEQQPRNFKDLIAINALIRPGTGDWEEYIARRKGKEWFVDPKRPWMHETAGTMTYQEQFLLDCHHLAGWTIAYADYEVRKKKAKGEGLKEKFIEDGVKNGHPRDYLESIWEEIVASVGDYSFNKSHSASYAMTSFQTAYLKCYYPEHFYASLMSQEKTDGDGQNAISGYIAEIKERGIDILPPDINDSDDNFVVSRGGIAYRITTIKHVGDSAIKHIRDLRPILSFNDFMERRDKSHAKKNVVVNLIKAGAFDFDNPKREVLLREFDMSQRTKTQIKNGYECPHYEVDELTYMEWEKEVLGMYLSRHPMERYGFKKWDEYREGDSALAGGEVVDVYDFHPKKDTSRPKMAFVTLNTLYGVQKCIFFASTRDERYRETKLWSDESVQDACQPGNIIMVKGKKSGKDMIASSVEILQPKPN